HFAVLREADLIEANKIGTTILYQLKLSVLEDALLGFTQLFGIGAAEPVPAEPADRAKPPRNHEGIDP
ncbi:MAG: helix-turn-helix domain-containing protein, partial [Pseudoxanthomonas sp.]